MLQTLLISQIFTVLVNIVMYLSHILLEYDLFIPVIHKESQQ